MAGYGFVTGRIVRMLGAEAESLPATGWIAFTPIDRTRRVLPDGVALVQHETVSVRIADGMVSARLVTGPFRVAFRLDGGAVLEGFDIVVSDEHTVDHPLDLAKASPAISIPGSSVELVEVPGGGADGDVLARTGSGLSWIKLEVVEGPQGEPGRDGVDGKPGEPGSDGANGTPGRDGADGAPGRDGVDGKDGADGTPGVDGKDGISGVVSVRDHGAIGDGTTDDTDAINAAIQAAAGGVLHFPAGTYMVNARKTVGPMNQPGGVRLDQACTTLRLDGAATIRAIPNNAKNYSTVQVTAADCRIEGGTIAGELDQHVGLEGEWGHAVDVTVGAHRLTITDTTVRDAWGDGICIRGAVEDVALVNVTMDHNRRQGLSIIDAIRPRVQGGAYLNTVMAPGEVGLGCGILVEPNAPGTGGVNTQVTDALITGVVATGNAGAGIGSSSNGSPLTLRVTGCVAAKNSVGFSVYSHTTNRTVFSDCTAEKNTNPGFVFDTRSDRIVAQNCVASENGGRGFESYGTRTQLIGCISRQNTGEGFRLDGANPVMSNCTAESNKAPNPVHIYGEAAILTGVLSDAGEATPSYGFVIRPSATGSKLIGCAVRGTFTSGPIANQATAAVSPALT